MTTFFPTGESGIPQDKPRRLTTSTSCPRQCSITSAGADPSYHKGNGFVYTFYKRNEDKMWVPLSTIRLGVKQQLQASTRQSTKQQKTDFFVKRTTQDN